MHIIFRKEYAEAMKDKYTVLELETFSVPASNGTVHNLESFCVVPAEKIPLAELPMLDAHKILHTAFITEVKNKNYVLSKSIHNQLISKFPIVL